MDTQSRGFIGIYIPKEIWFDRNINANEKVLLMEIDSLDKSPGGCYASNEYFADFLGVNETNTSKMINKLVKLGYVENIGFDGRKRHLKSNLKFTIEPYCKESSSLIENNQAALLKTINREYITINSNNKLDNKNKSLLPNLDNKKKSKISKNQRILELKQILKTFTLDIDLLEQLNTYIDVLADKNKLPTKTQLEYILVDAFKEKDKEQLLLAIKNSIKNAYTSIYIKSKEDIKSKDGTLVSSKQTEILDKQY